jgi:hypothetical protein
VDCRHFLVIISMISIFRKYQKELGYGAIFLVGGLASLGWGINTVTVECMPPCVRAAELQKECAWIIAAAIRWQHAAILNCLA